MKNITKNRRLFVIFATLCLIIFLSIFSSQLFKLKTVELCFYDEANNKVTNLSNNAFFNSNQKIDKVLSSANFDYGNLVFLIDKNNYIPVLERNNPYLKLENIQIKFPNKLVINASERKPWYFIKSLNNIYLLDEEFKLLEITSLNSLQLNNSQDLQNLLEIKVKSLTEKEEDFFQFFGVLAQVYEAGQNMAENNNVLKALLPASKIINSYLKNYSYANSKIFDYLVLQEGGTNIVNLELVTNSNFFGVKLKVENIFSQFSKKLNKLFNAFNSLKKQETIKCTYGQLKIDNNLNCYWNNL